MNVFGLDRQNSVPIEGRDIIIGKGVWVASGSIIIGPCVIGDNSVIGAGCVINKNIPKNSYCVMGTQDQLVTKKLRVTEPKRSC
jgi:acetyltransferase-like isoleucine patch superfamily enzyme